MTLTFLGTGTSCGVPVIGCGCEVCTSNDARDKRLRTSALLETTAGTHILIDCGPDFRAQALELPFQPFDAVLLTHEHYDHVSGLDDLRPYGVFGPQQIYGNARTLRTLRERMPYCFAKETPSTVPHLELHEISPGVAFRINELEILPVEVMHGTLPILGFRIGNCAYLTDLKTISKESMALLNGVETLIVNALRYKPHPTHQTIEDAIALSQHLKPRDTYLIHLNHDAPTQEEAERILPPHIHLAYDGLQIKV